MSNESIIDYPAEFLRLADLFDREGRADQNVSADVAREESPVQHPADTRGDLLRRRAIVLQVSEYREAVRSAGLLCINAYSSGLLGEVDGLAELVATMEVGEWGGLVHNEANLFALLVGGPRIELVSADGTISLMEKSNAGWPIQFRPATPQDSPDALASLRPSTESLPDSEQCVLYARFCRTVGNRLATTADRLHASPRAVRAMEQFRHICEAAEEVLTDDRAHELLSNAYDAASGLEEELGPLQSAETWKRYLRDYRKSTNSQKYRSRSGRAAESGSIVSGDQI